MRRRIRMRQYWYSARDPVAAAVFAVLASTSLLVGQAAPREMGSHVVSVSLLVEEAWVYVPVRVPGDTVRWFILDTGAQPTVLDAGVAAAAGLRPSGVRTTTGAGGGHVEITSADGVVVRTGSIVVGPQRVNVAPLDSLLGPSNGRSIPGIDRNPGRTPYRRQVSGRPRRQSQPAGRRAVY